MRIARSIEEHRARVAQLRALGYRVKIVTLPNGDQLVLTSKKRFVCRANHCLWTRDKGGAAAVTWPKKTAKRRKRK